MQTIRASRVTIVQFMVAIAIVGTLLAVPRMLRSPNFPVVPVSCAMLLILSLFAAAVEVMLGRICPVCSQRELRRLARHRHYYRCFGCRARLKRFGFGPWLDASGPEDASRYRKPSDAGIWKAFARPEKLGSSSSGRLLGTKRSGNLVGEINPAPRGAAESRRLEEATRKVRRFLKHRLDDEV